MTVKNVKIFWADAPKDGFKKLTDFDVPFKAEGCLHIEAEVRFLYFLTRKIKVALCIH